MPVHTAKPKPKANLAAWILLLEKDSYFLGACARSTKGL